MNFEGRTDIAGIKAPDKSLQFIAQLASLVEETKVL
jgi:hypothetical protein